MSSPKVCAVIVTYNGLKWIEKCIESLIRSTMSPDVFVIDNGSTDGTVEFLKQQGNCKFLRESNTNLGFGKANNVGLRHGYLEGYEYFLLLNQDAWVEENVIEHLVSNMRVEKQFGILSPMHFNGSGTGFDYLFESYLSRMESYQKDLEANNLSSGLYESRFINAACWLVSRTTLKEVGLFHPLFEHYGEDDNYLDRLHHKGMKLGLDPHVKIYHDRNQTEANPVKDDPHELFRRTLLRVLLDPGNRITDKEAFRKARKLTKKLSKKLSGISKLTFRISCLFKFYQIKKEVQFFGENRQSELSIN